MASILKPVRKKKVPYSKNFPLYWQTIKKNSISNEKYKFNDDNSLAEDYFDQVPPSQEFLTKKGMTCKKKVDYTDFNQTLSNQNNFRNLHSIFNGLFGHIFSCSDNKLNIQEIEFHFSGSKNSNRKKLNDILNIFSYENTYTEFSIQPIKNAFFGVTFKRIRIQPIAYSIRSGSVRNSSHLISFTFEAYDEEDKKWVILDERVNSNDLVPDGGFGIFYVRYTGKSYSSFKIKQLEPGTNDFWGFSLSGFDIHGTIANPPEKIENIDDYDLYSTKLELNDEYDNNFLIQNLSYDDNCLI